MLSESLLLARDSSARYSNWPGYLVKLMLMLSALSLDQHRRVRSFHLFFYLRDTLCLHDPSCEDTTRPVRRTSIFAIVSETVVSVPL